MNNSDNPFGPIEPPAGLAKYAYDPDTNIGILLSTFLRTLIVIAGVYAVINIILAGYAFLSAGDDSKKVAGAWAKIWQTIIGLAVAAGAFVLAAIFGQLIFKDPTFILNPRIPSL